MKILNHLIQDTAYAPSPNRSGKFVKGLPDTLIIHYTAGPCLESAQNTFLNKGSKASAHIIIERDGSMIQMVPFDTIAWHAGTSKWGKRKNLNNYSIGIELVNAGSLVKEKKGYSSWFGKNYTSKEVVKAVHRNEDVASYWHRYTDKQIKACESLCKLLVEEYGIQNILGHEEISPDRKIDPGPAFPLDEMRQKLLALKPKPEKASVIAKGLNIRKGPDTTFEKLAEPLPHSHKVQILEQKGEWVKVKTTALIEGWVAKRYLG